jgi:hypothetical protein
MLHHQGGKLVLQPLPLLISEVLLKVSLALAPYTLPSHGQALESIVNCQQLLQLLGETVMEHYRFIIH